MRHHVVIMMLSVTIVVRVSHFLGLTQRYKVSKFR
uniref:Uncharacterized protein n=1 Tax=Arundo donax TaxID=35708 RepID=A0A0A9AE21_ARUDO